MNNPEELNLKKTSNVDVTSEELIKMQENIPLLKLADNKDQNFIILIKLIKKMSDATYVSGKKYALMYKIMQIGNLLKGLLDENITKDVTAGTLKTFGDNTPLQKLSPQQQFALFNVNRNIAADFFPLLYESKMKLSIENFIKCAAIFCETFWDVQVAKRSKKIGGNCAFGCLRRPVFASARITNTSLAMATPNDSRRVVDLLFCFRVRDKPCSHYNKTFGPTATQGVSHLLPFHVLLHGCVKVLVMLVI